MSLTNEHHPSPGNQLTPELPPMRAPHLEYVYRLVAKMHPTDHYDIIQPQGTGISRGIAHIQSGTVSGPKIKGKVVENSGADWAERVHSKKIYWKLDARYTILTDDGHHIYIQAKGVFRPGPNQDFDYVEDGNAIFTQDDVEYFTHLTFEAAGDGPYNWMNGIVALGVMTSVKDQAIIDCWRMTNFPGIDVEDVYVGK